MIFVGKEANNKEIIKQNDNIVKEDAKIFTTLNLSSNNEKRNINNVLCPKENENKIIQTKEKEESMEIGNKNKYIKNIKLKIQDCMELHSKVQLNLI